MTQYPAKLPVAPGDTDELRAFIGEPNGVSAMIPDNWDTSHPETARRSNLVRATRAGHSVLAYAKIHEARNEDVHAVLQDFLADFMHLCDLTEIDFDTLVDTAHANYSAEVQGRFV